jgi:hypothetical protein
MFWPYQGLSAQLGDSSVSKQSVEIASHRTSNLHRGVDRSRLPDACRSLSSGSGGYDSLLVADDFDDGERIRIPGALFGEWFTLEAPPGADGISLPTLPPAPPDHSRPIDRSCRYRC